MTRNLFSKSIAQFQKLLSQRSVLCFRDSKLTLYIGFSLRDLHPHYDKEEYCEETWKPKCKMSLFALVGLLAHASKSFTQVM